MSAEGDEMGDPYLLINRFLLFYIFFICKYYRYSHGFGTGLTRSGSNLRGYRSCAKLGTEPIGVPEMFNSSPASTLTNDLRRILRLSAHPGSRHQLGKDRPTISQYARWCQCTPQLLGKFARGQSKSLGLEIIDDLALLTGVCPAIGDDDRTAFLLRADEWLSSDALQQQYPRVRDYLFQFISLSASGGTVAHPETKFFCEQSASK